MHLVVPLLCSDSFNNNYNTRKVLLFDRIFVQHISCWLCFVFLSHEWLNMKCAGHVVDLKGEGKRSQVLKEP